MAARAGRKSVEPRARDAAWASQVLPIAATSGVARERSGGSGPCELITARFAQNKRLVPPRSSNSRRRADLERGRPRRMLVRRSLSRARESAAGHGADARSGRSSGVWTGRPKTPASPGPIGSAATEVAHDRNSVLCERRLISHRKTPVSPLESVQPTPMALYAMRGSGVFSRAAPS